MGEERRIPTGFRKDGRDPYLPLHPMPWASPAYDEKDAYALKALFAGEATAEQQKRVVEWLAYACGADDLCVAPNKLTGTDTHGSYFANGKRFVWLQMKKIVQLKVYQQKQGDR